jgi:hypothetical protein
MARGDPPMIRLQRSLLRLVLAWLASCTMAGTTSAQGPPPPVERTTCGAYVAVPGAPGSSGEPTRVTLQKDGRIVATVSDDRITRLDCRDFERDGTREFLVSSLTAGAGCCETIRGWTIGSTARQNLVYESGTALGYDVGDLDGDGRDELLLWDDTFSAYDDLCRACAPARLPLIACPVRGRFDDCTKRFPETLRALLAREIARLEPPSSDANTMSARGVALGVLALSALLGEETKGLETIRRAVSSEAVMTWLERARPQVRAWAAARSRKIK